jgi:hypothetical protein
VGGVPGVVGDLLDLEQGRVGEDPLLDRAIVDHIAGGCLDEGLPGPEVVGHAVALGALPQVVFGYEIAREHVPEPILVLGREHPSEHGDVGRGREVEAAKAAPPAQRLKVDRTGAGIPGGEVDPALGLLGPLVEVQAPEGVLGAGERDRLFGLAREVVRPDRARGSGWPCGDLRVGPALGTPGLEYQTFRPSMPKHNLSWEAARTPGLVRQSKTRRSLWRPMIPIKVSCTSRILCL